MKSLDDTLETLRGPENLCNDIKIVIDNDDDDDDDTIIISDDDDDDECKSNCFIFFSEFHKNNVLNISRLNFEPMKFCLSTNVKFATWLDKNGPIQLFTLTLKKTTTTMNTTHINHFSISFLTR